MLCGPGWRQRLATEEPVGPTEAFLALVRQQVHARAADRTTGFGLECETLPPVPGLIEAASRLDLAMATIERPLTVLSAALAKRLDDEAADLDTAQRQRVEAIRRGLARRALLPLAAWRAMLRELEAGPEDCFVDWMSVRRRDGQDLDVALHRHWRDPMRPFAAAVMEPAHGVLVTSATLRDATGDEDVDWAVAATRSGARHLAAPPATATFPSPFDYAARTRVLVVGDVDRDDPAQVAAAYRELFLAAGGGGLGLFTAIHRLRATYDRIAEPLEAAGIPLLAQHVDVLDTGSLIDLFRAEEDSCLLGTDAVRDGIDVPGRALRLIVFDRVPWPRPDILHRARRQAFGGRGYDEMLTRLRLKQAFGRLVRRADDRGVFVMMDRALPSRLLGAFPPGVAVRRLGLKDALAETRSFLTARTEE